MKKFSILITILFLFNNCFSQVVKVAILDFENISGKEEYNTYGKVISNMLITDLKDNINSNKIEFFERTQLNKILDEQHIQNTKNFDAKTAVQVGKISGVNLIFIGSVFITNDQCILSCKLIDVKTSQIIISKDVNGKIEAFLKLKSELAKTLSEELKNPYNLQENDHIINKSTILQYGKVLNYLDKGKVDLAEDLCKEYSKDSEDFVYFKKLNNDIEKIKKQLEKNTKDIEVIKKAGGRIIDATSLKDLYYNLHLPTSTYEERKLVLIELLKQDLNVLKENNIYINSLNAYPASQIALWDKDWGKALELRNNDLIFCDSIVKSLYIHPKSNKYLDPYNLNKETAIIYLFTRILKEFKDANQYKTNTTKGLVEEWTAKYNDLNKLSNSKFQEILNDLGWAINDNSIPLNKLDQPYFAKNIDQFKYIIDDNRWINDNQDRMLSRRIMYLPDQLFPDASKPKSIYTMDNYFKNPFFSDSNGNEVSGKEFFEKNKSNILTIDFLWKMFDEIYNTAISN